MPSLDTLLAFLGISILITLAPGPDNLMVIGRSLARGQRAGLAFGLGCAAGCVTHIAWASLGVAALVRASSGLFLAIKLAGAAWLLCRGGLRWNAEGPHGESSKERSKTTETVTVASTEPGCTCAS